MDASAQRIYVQRFASILRAARLSLQYPDYRRLTAHVRALDPACHGGLYPELQLDLRTGLPTYREWTRVQTDVALAPKILEQLGSHAQLAQRTRDHPNSIYQRQLDKHAYYSRLKAVAITPLAHMQVDLRRIDHNEGRAYFSVVFDKLEASGLFVRVTIALSQRDGFWSRQAVRLDDDVAEQTEAFRSLIYKMTSVDPELTWLKLSSVGGLGVERLTRGTIGPLFVHPDQPRPAAGGFTDLLDGADAWLGTFALVLIGADVAEDRSNDPLTPVRRNRSAPYRVFSDRKFVAPADKVALVRDWCTRAGTKNIVYGARV